MVTEIKGTGAGAPTAVDTAARQGTRSTHAAPAAAPPGSTDVVTLTERAERLQHLREAVRDLPVVDTARVDAAKEALAAGSYVIDDQAVADKLAALEAARGRAERG